MKAAVLLRAVLDPEAPAGRPHLILDGPSLVALCQAVDWRKTAEATLAGIAVGPESWEAVLRESLALGLDAAELVTAPEAETRDVAWTAAAIAAALPTGTRFVFAGSAASDFGTGALPAALAGILDWPLLDDVVWARKLGDSVEVEVIAGPGKRRTYELDGPAVLAAARLSPPPVYAPLARRLAASRAPIGPVAADEAELPAPGRAVFLGYGPGKPRTRHLLKPSAEARPGDRLSQLMSGGPQRSASKLGGEAGDLARQLADILEKAGFLAS